MSGVGLGRSGLGPVLLATVFVDAPVAFSLMSPVVVVVTRHLLLGLNWGKVMAHRSV